MLYVDGHVRAYHGGADVPILVICWHLLTNDTDYDDLGGDYFTRRANPDRHRDHLIQQLQGLGYGVALTKIA